MDGVRIYFKGGDGNINKYSEGKYVGCYMSQRHKVSVLCLFSSLLYQYLQILRIVAVCINKNNSVLNYMIAHRFHTDFTQPTSHQKPIKSSSLFRSHPTALQS
jgi:hypothetical protein